MITNEEYAAAMHTLQLYMEQLQTPIELELLQNIFLSKIQAINRQIIKLKQEILPHAS
jgi:hypothetical protein